MQFTKEQLNSILKQPGPVDLANVDLSGADLNGAVLKGAKYDQNTRWPDGFDPTAAGAIFEGTRKF